MTLNDFTTNRDETLEALRQESQSELLRKLLEVTLNELLKAEASAQLRAEPYERTEERTDSRNGYRTKPLKTRVGTLYLDVPRFRNGSFESMIFDNYARSEAALIATMAEMVVNGVSTRKVTKVMETLCGLSFSKSEVSNVCKTLDKEVKEFQERPLDDSYPFLWVDATYFKVRVNHRVTSRALMIATAMTKEGFREVIGFSVYDNESKRTWTEFMRSLKKRGLRNVRIITSDAHEGIRHAIAEVFPTTPWQRCQVHFTRNILDHTPAKEQTGLKDELREMFSCQTIEKARTKKDQIVEEYSDVAERAMDILEAGFEDAMTVMVLPKQWQQTFRSTNYLERLNRELKRRSNVIGVFPDEASLNRLMGSVLLDQHDAYQHNIYFRLSKPAWKAFPDACHKLERIALEQRALLEAA